MLFMCMGLLRRKYLTKCCIFLILRLREFTWFHNWWLAKSWTPVVEQLFHNRRISLISSCPLWNTSLFWWIKGIYIVPQLVIGQRTCPLKDLDLPTVPIFLFFTSKGANSWLGTPGGYIFWGAMPFCHFLQFLGFLGVIPILDISQVSHNNQNTLILVKWAYLCVISYR